MPLLFISHSSKDKAEAEQLLQWLEDQGFEALFLDSDARHGIKAGSDWEKTLYREIHRSHAFIFLLSDHWTASQWCNFEFMQARALGKAIFPLRIQTGLDTTIAADIQHLDLTKDRDDALQRLHTELTELSLNTGQHTVWDRSRSPYPGMMAFEAEDAPVFFGRDDEIRRLRERLDQHRIQGSAALLVLLAASGAGKSSLIRAGLLPRLRHDKRHWLVTEAMRPEREPLRKLAQVLAVAAGQDGKAEDLFAGLQGEQALAVLSDTLHQIRAQHQQTDSTLLLSIDQAEELFTTAKPEQTRQLLELLAAAEAEHLPIQTLLAMRSEYLETLQALLAQQAGGSRLSHDLLTLDTLPLERISQLIRGPAKVAGLAVEDGLLSAATQDAATTDALPLLAFALRELYEQFGADGDLTLAEYQQLGSDQLNPLENVVQDKAAQAIRPQQLSEAELKALREAFIPQMVRVNESGDYVRQAANWQDLPAVAHPLLDKLTNARLLVKRDDQVEVSHEALLRHWGLLNGWLREEHDFLLGKQQLEMSLYDWQQLPEGQRDKGLLRGIALERAREWLFADKAGLSAAEKEFIRRSHQVEEQQRKGQRNRLLGFVAALVVVAGVAVWQAFSATQAEKVAKNKEQQEQIAREQAEDIISFMIFDLNQKLDTLGRLDIVKDVQDRVLEYYENRGDIPIQAGQQQSLWQIANITFNSGDRLIAEGKLKAGEQQYRDAKHIIELLIDSMTPSDSLQFRLASILSRLADVLLKQNDVEEANRLYRQSSDIMKKLSIKNPNYQNHFANSLEKLADTLRIKGKLDDAIAQYEKSCQAFMAAVKNNPNKALSLQGLAGCLSKKGNIFYEQNKLDEAQIVYEKSWGIAKKLTEHHPEDARHKPNLATTLQKLGKVFYAQKKFDQAKTMYEKSIDIFQSLADSDPSNARNQSSLSAGLDNIGKILSAQGKHAEAKSFFEKGHIIIETLAMSNPSNPKFQLELAQSHISIMDAATQNSELNAAHHGKKALNILKLLDKQGLLHEEQQEWIGDIEEMLEQLN